MARDISKLPMHQSNASYMKQLRQLLKVVSDPEFVLRCDNSDVVGDKYTKCNAGLCGDEAEAVMDGVYRDIDHKCPLDMGTGIAGCFYRCRVFQKRMGRDDVRDVVVAFCNEVGASVESETALLECKTHEELLRYVLKKIELELPVLTQECRERLEEIDRNIATCHTCAYRESRTACPGCSSMGVMYLHHARKS